MVEESLVTNENVIVKQTKSYLDFAHNRKSEDEIAKEKEQQTLLNATKKIYLAFPPSDTLRTEGRYLLGISAVSSFIAKGLKIKEIGMFDIKAELNESILQVILFMVVLYLTLSFLMKFLSEWQEWKIKLVEAETSNQFCFAYIHSSIRLALDVLFPLSAGVLAIYFLYQCVIGIAKTL